MQKIYLQNLKIGNTNRCHCCSPTTRKHWSQTTKNTLRWNQRVAPRKNLSILGQTLDRTLDLTLRQILFVRSCVTSCVISCVRPCVGPCVGPCFRPCVRSCVRSCVESWFIGSRFWFCFDVRVVVLFRSRRSNFGDRRRTMVVSFLGG